MTDFAQSLKNRFYRNSEHPYEVFEREISSLIRPGDVLLDAPEFDNSSSSTRRHLNGIKGLASFGEFSCNGTSLSVCSSFQ